MTDYTIFSLIGPMGSFGDLAGHERRGSLLWPGRSAILGLIGAASGVRRSNQHEQDKLKQWKTAVSILDGTVPWVDFHTIQTIPSRIKQPSTRRDAIAALKPNDNGLITLREYISDCAFGVAVWGGDTHALAKALNYPKFVPYLGRKSCPLSAPMAAKCVQAGSFKEALHQITLPYFSNYDPRRPNLITADEEDEKADLVETRWDEPLDRKAWHFGPRLVYRYQSENT